MLLVLVGIAHAQPAKKTKQAPDKFARAASEAFTTAAAADAQGDLRTALGLYEKAHAISPHPSTIYNVADVQRRLQMLTASIKSYETYLVMYPDAKDRAEVEAQIDQLQKVPATLVIVTIDATSKQALDLPAGYLIVDGEIKRRPGPISVKPGNRAQIEIKVPAGKHVIDFVTSLTYATRSCDIGPGEQRFCELRAEPRIDGNLVASASDRSLDVLAEQRGKDIVFKRVELPPGKRRLLVKDRSYHCRPVPVVLAANTVTYAFLATNEDDGLKRCRTLDIKQHRLQFEP